MIDPSISFFRDYLESVGCKLPQSAYKSGDHKLAYEVDDSDEDEMDEVKEIGEPHADYEEGGILFYWMLSLEEKLLSLIMILRRKWEIRNFEEAIEHLKQTISLHPTSAIMYATKATVYIEMKKTNAAIRDANAALEINPDSEKGHKSRGIARAILGQWEVLVEEATKYLYVASSINYDDEISVVLKKVKPNAHKIEEHRRKYDRMRKEREDIRLNAKDSVVKLKLKLWRGS
ncbi:hypothetical protein AgCh_027281 [Apium graveolens]